MIYFLILCIYVIYHSHNALTLASIKFFSPSPMSIAKSITARDEHFRDLTFLALFKYFEMPIQSPRISPLSIFQTGMLFSLAKAIMSFLYEASVTSSAKTTNLGYFNIYIHYFLSFDSFAYFMYTFC